MNDDLVRIFAQPHATFRPRAAGPHAAPACQANLRGDGGPHIEHREQPVSEQSVFRPEPDPLDRDSSPADPLGDCQVEAIGLRKSYRKASVEIPVLKGVDLAVRRSEFLAIVGQSGSGKSTLLHLLGTLDCPDRGQIAFEGRRIDNLPGRERDQLRNRRFGMIFQFYHLLPELTTLENVLAPLMIGSSVFGFLRSRRRYRRAATRLLELVGLAHRLKHRPRELSGGEMQRAAIARALIVGPDLLLADEPTGNLDQATGREILELLTALNRQQKLTIVMVTHDPAIAERADRVVRLLDGRIA
jgi:lipoprotein-releasing system ATP-binding protein